MIEPEPPAPGLPAPAQEVALPVRKSYPFRHPGTSEVVTLTAYISESPATPADEGWIVLPVRGLRVCFKLEA